QLYDMEKDPYENVNLAAKQPAVVEQLRQRLAYHQQFAREPEKPSKIPGYPVTVYGEQEEARYGKTLKPYIESNGFKEKDQSRGRGIEQQ
ncbi:MAG: hypothetical protein KJT03_10680, partial [Verrucomicrobiae bacterium]|nr:hypothetical protein [Verrucomicrobiae bacterium]